METTALIAELEFRLATYENDLQQHEEAVATVKPIVINLRGTIEALKASLAKDTRTGNLPFVPEPSQIEANNHGHNGNGNSATRRPARRPEFEAISVIESARLLLSKSPRGLHADVITRSIYDCKTRDQFHVAKHSVVAEMIRGAKRGIFRKLGGNRFHVKKTEASQTNVSHIRDAS